MSLLSWLAALVVRVLGRSLRLSVVGPAEPEGPVLYAFHHGRQFGLLHYRPARGAAVMSSLSRDGRLQAKILARLGYAVVAGSSSKGGAGGLRGLVRHVRRGLCAGFAVDGPKGPPGVVKPGIVALARMTGAPIVPLSFAAPGRIFEKAWDRYLLPRPFCRGVIARGDALKVARDASPAAVEETRRHLENALRELDRAAEGWGEGGSK
jgi:lysophospholipid acyltransferase (LPLAT)-like uncharacterized protein